MLFSHEIFFDKKSLNYMFLNQNYLMFVKGEIISVSKLFDKFLLIYKMCVVFLKTESPLKKPNKPN